VQIPVKKNPAIGGSAALKPQSWSGGAIPAGDDRARDRLST